MSIAFSTYYDLIRLRELGPESKDWAVTDKNFQVISLILKAFEQHVHNGAPAMSGPGIKYTNVNVNADSPYVQFHTPYPATLPNNGRVSIGVPTTNTGTVIGYNPSTGIANVTWDTNPNLAYTNDLLSFVVPTITEQDSGGSLAPGTTVGIRLSFLNSAGLETEATSEVDFTLGLAIQAPDAPILSGISAYTGGISGGTYVYVMTKANGGGETVPSAATPVSIPYDQTYQVTIDWDTPISALTDGTTMYNIYRSAGLNSTFQLVGQVTDTSATTFTDLNVPVDQTQQPPSTSTFDQTKMLILDWSLLTGTYPPAASKMNVYVTQQPGIWATQHLLTQVDLTATSIPSSYNYLGSETLSVGYPYDTTQIPASPPPVDANAIFPLSAAADFNNMQALNFVFENRSGVPAAPTNGKVYYDESINNIRAYINGTWVNWGVSVGGGYTHPAEEVGGHLANNIRWVGGNATPNLGSMLSKFFNTAGSTNPNAAQKIVSVNGGNVSSAFASTSSTTPVQIDNSILNTISADAVGQAIEVRWDAQMANLGGGLMYYAIYVDGSEIVSSRRWFSVATYGMPATTSTIYTAPDTASHTFTVYWWMDSSSHSGYVNTYNFYSKVLL